MTAETMTEATADLELTVLNAEASSASFDNAMIDAMKRGLPPEIAARLEALWDKTATVAGEVVAVGKIIVMKILAFLKAHPELSAALGVAAAAYLLFQLVPYIGPLLAPIAALFSGVAVMSKTSDVEGAIQTAKDFFALLVGIFNTLKDRYQATA